MSKLIAQLGAGIITLRLAHLYLPGVFFEGDLAALITAGLFLGVLNFFIKPILKIITLPLQILTLGLFSFIINIVIVYLVDLAFYELIFEGFWPLTSFIVLLWLINLFLSSILE
jgi:putative membrane protein